MQELTPAPNHPEKSSITPGSDTSEKIILPFEPSSVWLHELGERPMSPIADQIRSRLRDKLLLNKDAPDFAERFVAAGRKHGFVVVQNDSIDVQEFRSHYQTLANVFSQSQDWLKQFGFPGSGKDDGYIPAETEISVSAHGTGHQANIFQFIHRVANGNNVNISDELGQQFANTSDALLKTLYAEARNIARTIAVGLQSAGFLTPEGVPVPAEYLLSKIEDSSQQPGDLTLLRLTHCRAIDLAGRNVAGCTMSHTDLNAFTILPAPTKEGLQIWYEDRENNENSGWVQLDAPKDSFAYIVNFADQMDILTGSYLQSTPHRVVSPIGEDRYSIILFVGFQRDLDLQNTKLSHPDGSQTSRFEIESALRMPGQRITAQSFTDLRKFDIGLISRDVAENQLGFIPLDRLRKQE